MKEQYESQPQTVRYTKKVVKLGSPIFVIFMIGAILATAVMVTMTFHAQQLGTMETPGTNPLSGLRLGGDQGYEEMRNLDINFYHPTCLNGQNKSVHYNVTNVNTHPYMIYMNVTQDWFTNTSSPYYGWTFGVSDYPNTAINLDHVLRTIQPGEVLDYTFWYKADPYYATPPNGTSPVNIQIEYWAY